VNAVDARNVRVQYERVVALDGVSLTLPEGIALGIVGPNGSGKSTLLKTIAGLVRPSAGTITVFGKLPQELEPGTIGYVPQIEDVDWSFPANVRDVVSMGRYPRLGPFARFGAKDRAAVDDALAALDLTQLADRHISQLSGGQQQRAFVARAIAQEPKLLLLDEPTTGVDAATEESLLGVIRASS
jgi:manganese transport system ATP-binding protein